jgi:prepilin-type N-terminal cleavage/methylation domain-containing protein
MLFGLGVRQRGFTLIEILIAVAIIGVLVGLAVVSFTKQSRKARGSEVQAMFAALRIAQEQYHLENGRYLSTGANEGDIFPATPMKTSQPFTPMPTTWVSLKVKLPDENGYCGYTVVAGMANNGTSIGAVAASFGFTTPTTDWYYLLARCDLDGNSTRDSLYFSWSGDPALQKRNEGY